MGKVGACLSVLVLYNCPETQFPRVLVHLGSLHRSGSFCFFRWLLSQGYGVLPSLRLEGVCFQHECIGASRRSACHRLYE